MFWLNSLKLSKKIELLETELEIKNRALFISIQTDIGLSKEIEEYKKTISGYMIKDSKTEIALYKISTLERSKKLEKLVASINLCKKLREAGWESPTLFVWVCVPGEEPFVDFSGINVFNPDHVYWAPTINEISLDLPNTLGEKHEESDLTFLKADEDVWAAAYKIPSKSWFNETRVFSSDRIQDVGAEIWCWYNKFRC